VPAYAGESAAKLKRYLLNCTALKPPFASAGYGSAPAFGLTAASASGSGRANRGQWRRLGRRPKMETHGSRYYLQPAFFDHA
jgi:hypothetical protein